MEEIKAALQEAIHAAGGITQFAKDVQAPSVSAIKAWKRSGSVPADYCPVIERVTGVTCERLRPTVDWAYLRQTTPTPTKGT